ncbi:PaaI family thioesterase [Breoghania sp.]|uniref:PaaI family thioesterase n=1 Tax=Breoghania sp. TaxID=2065378 RepID=UPI002AA8FF0F|nr:PaaI family thioesterase [Breoghania sp.]
MTVTMNEEDRMQQVADTLSPFADALKMRTVSHSREKVVGEMVVEPWLGNRNGVLHGGALMSLADNVCGTATFLNLGEGQSTVTLESKTNFMRPIRIGDVARATVTPYHVGRTTMIWEVKVTRGDGKLCAVVTQTQLVLEWKESSAAE